jgi:hypothetical protein
MSLPSSTLDLQAVATGALIPGQNVSSQIASKLNKEIYFGHRLADLLDESGPLLTMMSTDLVSGRAWANCPKRESTFVRLRPDGSS